VIGASVDTSELNAEFAAKEELAYELVSDPTRELADELGLLTGAEPPVAARTSYLLAPDGAILRIWEVGGGDAIDAHPGEVLQAVRASCD
jgi:peroxiredoxin